MSISITLILIILTALVSWQALSNQEMQHKLLHSPYLESKYKEYHRWLTSMFVHADMTHLAVNMLVLYQIGSTVEKAYEQLFGKTFGMVLFIALYLLSGIFANVFSYFKHRDNSTFSSVGASGGTSGLLFTYVLFFPWNWFLFPPLPGFLLGIAYLIYSTWASKHSNDRIDHDAHLNGALFGLAFTLMLKPGLFTRFLELMSQPEPPPFF